MKQEQQPAGQIEQPKVIHLYTDAELIAELKRRGFECYKWPNDDWPTENVLNCHNMNKLDE